MKRPGRWKAPRRTTPGVQPTCSELAVGLMLVFRLVCRPALRQPGVFTASALLLLKVAVGGGPMQLVLDSTGLQLFGQGAWDAERHGREKRRWLKLPLDIDATMGEVAAHVRIGGTAGDAA